MKESQTPYKFYARSSEKRNRKLKNSSELHKNTTKCLNAAFTSVSEHPVDSSPVSEISYANRDENTAKSFLEEASTEMLLPSDVMPSKRITKEAGIGSTKFLDAYELNSEPEVAAINLGNAKPEVFNSRIAATQYKKLMDEITNYVMEDRVNTVAEDLDRFYQVPSAKNQMVFLCFCIWIIGVLAMFFFTSDIHCPHGGPYLT